MTARVTAWVLDEAEPGLDAAGGALDVTSDPLAAQVAILNTNDTARVGQVRMALRAGLPLLAVTSNDADLEELLAAGADDHLVWPRDRHLLPARARVLARRRSDEALRASEARLRALVDLARDAVFMKDTDGRYLVINPVAARMFGRSPAEVIGRTDEELLGAERAADMVNSDRDVMRTRQPVLYERPRRIGDEERMFVSSKVPYVDPTGEVLGVIVIAHDITDRRRMEGQLHLADRMVSVGTLASGVAHEINNPLTYVMANLAFARSRVLHVMDGRADPSELGEVLPSIDDSIEGAARIRGIVGDMRTFTRPDEAGCGPVEVGRVIDIALRMTQHANRHRARVIEGPRAVPAVLANASRLGQVLVNLLVNALQAMPAGRDTTQNEVEIGARVREDRVVIELRDNGVGMPDDVRRRVFDPFFTTKPVGVGTGLGLWTCRNIVTGMGGDVTVESAPGVGSRFQVWLPMAPTTTAPPAGEAVLAVLGPRSPS